MSVAHPHPHPAAPADVGAYAPPAAPTAACAECGAALAGPYCAQCGQRAPGPDDLTLRRFARAAAQEVSGTDARLVASLWALVRYPGRLTREFVDGHRRRWASPVQLFLLASAAYFLVGWPAFLRATDARSTIVPQILAAARHQSGGDAGLLRRATAAAVGSDAVFERWTEFMGWGKFAGLVGLAAVAWALHRRRGEGGLRPMTFALHYYAFDFTLYTAVMPLLLVAQRLRGAPVPQGPVMVLLAANAAYLYLAVRRVYGEGRARAGWKAAALLATDAVVTATVSGFALGAAAGEAMAAAGR